MDLDFPASFRHEWDGWDFGFGLFMEMVQWVLVMDTSGCGSQLKQGLVLSYGDDGTVKGFSM